MALAFAGHIALNFLFSMFLLAIAGVNYPGGIAIARMHRLASPQQNVSLHIDNLSAQTGVSKFTQVNPNWTYDKEENLTASQLLKFTHLLVEAKSKYSANLKPFQKSHKILESVDGFSQIMLNYNIFPPLRIKTKPMIFILERTRDEVIMTQEPRIKNLKVEAVKGKSTEVEEEKIAPEVLQPDEKESIQIKEILLLQKDEKSISDAGDKKELETPKREERSIVQELEKEIPNEILDEEIMAEIQRLEESSLGNEEEKRKVKERIKDVLLEFRTAASVEIEGTEKSDARQIKSLRQVRVGNESQGAEPEKDLEEVLTVSRESAIGHDGIAKNDPVESKREKKKSRKGPKEENPKAKNESEPKGSSR